MQIIQQWQTLLSALVGFTGVILVMLYNARSARRLAQTAKDQETLSVCMALQQELISYRDYLRSLLRNIELLPSNSGVQITIRPIITRQIFDANVGKIGLLQPQQTSLVLTAYHLQGELLPRLSMLGEQKSEKPEDGLTIGGQNFQPLAAILKMHATAAAEAIKLLGPSISGTALASQETGDVGFMDAETALRLGLVADPITGELGFKPDNVQNRAEAVR